MARPLPEVGQGPCPRWGGCKHVHLAVNPLNGRIYLEGGDYPGSVGDDSYRNETYSYSIANDDWILEYPYCGPAGDIQPDHPDEVGWVWDSRRQVFWMIPGYLESLRNGQPGCGGAIQRWGILVFDPITRKWSPGGVHWPNTGGTERPKFAQYDPVTDTIIMLNQGMSVDILNLGRDWNSPSRWERFALSFDSAGVSLSNSYLGSEGTAIDVAGRAIYVIEPYSGRLIRYHIDTRTASVVSTAPDRSGDDGGPPNPPGSPQHREDFTQLAFDSQNRVLFFMRLSGAGEVADDLGALGHAGYVTLYIYDPATGQWTRDPMSQPEGRPVRGNSIVYDAEQNALLLIGGLTTDNHPTSSSGEGPKPSHLFLYRYGEGIALPPTTGLAAAVSPSSRSVPVGGTATAFATVINSGSAGAAGCTITPRTALPAAFAFQATDRATNHLVGDRNAAVDIPAGAAQSFVLWITPAAEIAPVDVELTFACTNAAAAPTAPGLNTLSLSATLAPVADVVALVATPGNDGVVRLSGAAGTGAFSVAAVNLGIGARIAAEVDTGSASLPLSVSICETDPVTGVCLGAPAPGVTTELAANATRTFGVFAASTSAVPFDPARSRIFVRFRDEHGVARGATSAAVTAGP